MYPSMYTYVHPCIYTYIRVYIRPCIYLDGGVAVSLDRSHRNEPRKLGAKGYSRDMKTWRLWKRRNICERGIGTKGAGNEKSDREKKEGYTEVIAEKFLFTRLRRWLYLCEPEKNREPCYDSVDLKNVSLLRYYESYITPVATCNSPRNVNARSTKIIRSPSSCVSSNKRTRLHFHLCFVNLNKTRDLG